MCSFCVHIHFIGQKNNRLEFKYRNEHKKYTIPFENSGKTAKMAWIFQLQSIYITKTGL